MAPAAPSAFRLFSAPKAVQGRAMSLKTTGIEIRRLHPEVPTHVQVFGERSSGTNFVNRLLGKNTGLETTDRYGWKHGFAQMTGVGKTTLIVAVAREPLAWARSMHSKPWHCPPQMQALEFSGFIRAEWDTIIDRRRYFQKSGEWKTLGTPLQQDRHPITGQRFANIGELRTIKLAWALGLRNRGVNLVLCRLDAVQADPEGFVRAVAQGFGVDMAEEYRPVTKRLGSRFLGNVDPRPATPDEINATDRAFLAGALDPRLEAAWGFSPVTVT